MKAAKRLNYQTATRILWCLTVASMLIWTFVPRYVLLWDLRIYENAVVSIKSGHDPYLDAMSVQRAFHEHQSQHVNISPPYSYVYSPITLPLLRLTTHGNVIFCGMLYGILYLFCISQIVRFGLYLTRAYEHAYFGLLAPVMLFFPGLLHQDTIWSGNVAIILYGLALGGVMYGLRKGSWLPFYVAVGIASCFKAPLVSLAAIPFLCAENQRWKASLLAGFSIVLFGVQQLIWPALFKHFIEAVNLQFLYNRDFGSSPAGVVANLLYTVAPYQVVSAVTYLAYAVPVGMLLVKYSKLFRNGRIAWQDWGPVMLLGVLLLNPRLMEYDLEPIALPMALILWRFIRRSRYGGKTGTLFVAALVLANLIAIVDWKATESVILVVVFSAGIWNLTELHHQQEEMLSSQALNQYCR